MMKHSYMKGTVGSHSFEYQTDTEPNRFLFTPRQIARACLQHGRAKDAERTVRKAADGSLRVSLTLTRSLIQHSCRTVVDCVHGGCSGSYKDRYTHKDDGSLLIEIWEAPLQPPD